MAYGDRWYVYDSSATVARGQDPYGTGYVHRATIRQSGYAGSTSVLKGHADGSGPILIEHGRPGPPDLFEPLPGSVCTLRLAADDAALGTLAEALVGQGDAAFEVVVERAPAAVYADDAAFTAAASLVWRGVTLQESTDHLAYAAAYGAVDSFTLQAVDGFGLLGALPFEGRNTDVEGTYPAFPSVINYGSVLGAIFRALSSLTDDGNATTGLSGLDALYTLDTWRPWLPDPLTAADDPVDVTDFLRYAFLDDRRGVEATDGAFTAPMLEVLQVLLARKAMRLVQSGGSFYALQRTALGSGSPTLFKYAAADGALDGSYPQSVNLLFDDDGQKYVRGDGRDPRRILSVPVREARVTYAWLPEGALDDVVLNGSFESGTGTDADDWTQTASATRIQYGADGDSSPGGWTATYEDTYGMRIDGGATAEKALSQAAPLYLLPGKADAEEANWLRWRWRSHVLDLGGFVPEPLTYSLTATSEGGANTHQVERFDVVCGGDALPGKDVPVPIEPLFSSYAGSGTEGALCLVAGTKLYFTAQNQYDGLAAWNPVTVTLAEPAYVGDRQLVGEVSGALSAGLVAWAYAWNAWDGTAGDVTPFELPPISAAIRTGWHHNELRVPMVSVDGASVAGYPELAAWRPVDADAVGFVDGVTLGLFEDASDPDGESITELERRAVAPDVYGLIYDAGAFPVGDGPKTLGDGAVLSGAYSGLFAGPGSAAAAARYATYQGEDTGWKDGLYAAMEATTGYTLDALHARSLVRAQSQALERRRMTLLLRGGDTFEPHQVLKHRHGGPGTATFKLYAWDYLRYDTRRGEVGFEGTEVIGTSGGGGVVPLEGGAPVDWEPTAADPLGPPNILASQFYDDLLAVDRAAGTASSLGTGEWYTGMDSDAAGRYVYAYDDDTNSYYEYDMDDADPYGTRVLISNGAGVATDGAYGLALDEARGVLYRGGHAAGSGEAGYVIVPLSGTNSGVDTGYDYDDLCYDVANDVIWGLRAHGTAASVDEIDASAGTVTATHALGRGAYRICCDDAEAGYLFTSNYTSIDRFSKADPTSGASEIVGSADAREAWTIHWLPVAERVCWQDADAGSDHDQLWDCLADGGSVTLRWEAGSGDYNVIDAFAPYGTPVP